MVDVTIYTRMMCGYCTAAKRLLDEQGRCLHRARCELFAGTAPGNDRTRANGRSTFPQIFIGDRHVGGCDDLHELDRQGSLDGLLANGIED